LLDHAFIAAHTAGFDAAQAAWRALDWASVEELSGLSREQIEAFTDDVTAAGSVIVCWAMGLTQHRNAVATIREVVNTLLLRRTFPELEGSLLQYFRRDVPRYAYRSYSESKHQVEWLNGSITRFGYCANESDVYQYQGGEYLFIGVDELTHFTLRQWQFLTSRNRCAVPGSFPGMAGATNPGNIGHAWVKSLWVDGQPAAGMERPEEYNGPDYEFIPARFSDNPIFAADESYKATLTALPTHLKRAFLDGDWDVIAGQYFDRFDVRRHVGRAEEIEWKPWWPRWISIGRCSSARGTLSCASRKTPS